VTEGEARTAALTGGLLPATEWVEVNGLRLRCLVWGAAEEPTAVLVHGNGAHAHWWDTLIPALVPGWRLVAPDLRGHGESSWAEPPSYLMRDFAADLGGVLSALAPGLTPRAVLETLAGVQMLDVEVPTTDGRWLVMSRYTQPEKAVALLLARLKMKLPEQPPPRLSAKKKLMT